MRIHSGVLHGRPWTACGGVSAESEGERTSTALITEVISEVMTAPVPKAPRASSAQRRCIEVSGVQPMMMDKACSHGTSEMRNWNHLYSRKCYPLSADSGWRC